MESEIIKSTREKMNKVIESLNFKFSNVRAGRANPSMLDQVRVEYYGTPTPIKSLATVSVPEARQLMIKPFDKSSLSSIEKAIYEANLGVTPNNNGECVFIVIPELNEERRKDLVKQVKSLSEEAKISLRAIRQEANNDIKEFELPQDEETRCMDRVQDLITEFNKKVEEILANKEKELMSI